MIGYYDYVLALIPTALVGVPAALLLLGTPLLLALALGGSAALVVVAHALFVNSPLETSNRDSPRGSRRTNAD